MMKLVVTINSEIVRRIISVEQIISIRRIATYLKIVSQQANMMVAQIDIPYTFFFYLGFVSRTFTIQRSAREGGGHSINSSLPLPSASRALRHWPGDCCGELTSAHSQQPGSNREPLVSERKSVTTKLRALVFFRSFSFSMLRSHK